MESDQAIYVLQNLANGIDPVSGEVFPLNSPYNHPTVIRAMYTCLHLLRLPSKKGKRTVAQRQAENLAQNLPRNAGLPWTDELRQALVEQYQAAATPNALAEQFERTLASVLAQLVKQGAMTEEQSRAYR